MSAKLPWIERTWRFDFPVELFSDILERLRGTHARIEDLLGDVRPDVLTRREKEGTWSIQENLGHLLDAETLWMGRLDDFLAGAPRLRPADMTNRRTHKANHTDRPIAELLSTFGRERGSTGSMIRTSPGPPTIPTWVSPCASWTCACLWPTTTTTTWPGLAN